MLSVSMVVKIMQKIEEERFWTECNCRNYVLWENVKQRVLCLSKGGDLHEDD